MSELGAEFGMAGFAAEAWFGLHAHRTAPDAVVARMAEAANGALADLALLAERGTQPKGGPSAGYASLVAAERVRWREVVRQGNIRVQ